MRRERTERSEIDAENPFRKFLQAHAQKQDSSAASTSRTPSGRGRDGDSSGAVVARPSDGSRDDDDAPHRSYSSLMLRIGFELIGFGDISVTHPNLKALLINGAGP